MFMEEKAGDEQAGQYFVAERASKGFLAVTLPPTWNAGHERSCRHLPQGFKNLWFLRCPLAHQRHFAVSCPFPSPRRHTSPSQTAR